MKKKSKVSKTKGGYKRSKSKFPGYLKPNPRGSK